MYTRMHKKAYLRYIFTHVCVLNLRHCPYSGNSSTTHGKQRRLTLTIIMCHEPVLLNANQQSSIHIHIVHMHDCM